MGKRASEPSHVSEQALQFSTASGDIRDSLWLKQFKDKKKTGKKQKDTLEKMLLARLIKW